MKALRLDAEGGDRQRRPTAVSRSATVPGTMMPCRGGAAGLRRPGLSQRVIPAKAHRR